MSAPQFPGSSFGSRFDKDDASLLHGPQLAPHLERLMAVHATRLHGPQALRAILSATNAHRTVLEQPAYALYTLRTRDVRYNWPNV